MNSHSKKELPHKPGLADLIAALLPSEGVIAPCDGLSVFRLNDSFGREPYSYNSEIIILAQGKKHVYLGNEVYTYDPSRYLVLPVPLPAECAGTAAPGQPILGLSISVNPVEVGEMLLGTDARSAAVGSLPRGIYDAPMNEALYDCAFRLIDALRDPDDRKVLAPMIKREIVYRVLKGEKGEILQSLILGSRRFFRIARVLQRIHESPENDFDVENLARELNMSNSTFHSSFKAVTDTSPLQYIKSVRLHKARKLMVQDGLNASTAAIHVGYESSSQFNREYKRLFGVTPGRDASAV